MRHGWRERHLAHPREGRFGHFGHEERHGHRRHGGRLFDQGDLRWVILSLIAEKPSHGYELIKAIEEKVGGAYSPSPGVVYPTLTLLEDLGHIAPLSAEGARKAFAITPEGEAALAEHEPAVKSIFERVASFAERAGRGGSPQIVRAMENLRLALRLKLERTRPTEDEITRIAAALDAAAQAIERD
jgi:DNA-binding PadR family transcriptional regulator